jgi:hypothetical protein
MTSRCAGVTGVNHGYQFWPAGPEGDDFILILVRPYQIDIMNLEQGIAPEPYGLRPLILTKELERWVVLVGDQP